MNKVICIGWHKTGTTTMGEALLVLGYSVVGARMDMADDLLMGNVASVLEEAQNFEAFQDVPWAALFKEMDAKFPGSKFILTIRDDMAWLKSASNHFADKHYRLHKWLYGVGILKGNEELYLQRYRTHNEEVLNYFKDRPKDLLIIRWEDWNGWSRLCSFLERPIPSRPFPFANKGKHNYSLLERMYDRVRNLLPVETRRSILNFLGRKDRRNRFHNFNQNQHR